MPPSKYTCKTDEKKTVAIELQLKTDSRTEIGKEHELQNYALSLYAIWLTRATIRRAGIKANTSRPLDFSMHLP